MDISSNTWRAMLDHKSIFKGKTRKTSELYKHLGISIDNEDSIQPISEFCTTKSRPIEQKYNFEPKNRMPHLEVTFTWTFHRTLRM